MRIIKWLGIAVLTFLVVLIIAVAVTLWTISTPEKLTPFVNKQAKEYLSCNTNIEKVEPSFFSTYPFIGVELTNLCLTENSNSSQSDTLLYASKCFGSLNLKLYLFEGNIEVKPFLVEDGFIHYKIDAQGNSNFDIFKSSSDSTTENSEASSFGDIDISNVEFKNFNLAYTDEKMLGAADIRNINGQLQLEYTGEKQNFDLEMQLEKLQYITSDSMALNVEVKNGNLSINSNAEDKKLFHSDLKLACEEIFVSMYGAEYCSNLKLDTHLPFNFNLSENSFHIEDANLKVNDEHEVLIGGMIEILADNTISTDIKYATEELDLEKIIPLIPEAYSDLFEDITVKGYAQLNGSVIGTISDTIIPVVTANIEYNTGEVAYTDYPPVKDIIASMLLKVDMNNSQASNITLNKGSGKIENSTVSVKGKISNILEDLEYDIYADGKFNLADFEAFVPSDINLIVQGKIDGDLHTQFTQDDLDRELYHRFIFKGDFDTENLHIVYEDTVQLNSTLSNVKLSMPGNSGGDANRLLANIKIDAPDLNVNMSSDMHVEVQNIKLSADINNLAKGVSAPITLCNFKLDKLSASYDTLSVHASYVDGELEYAPKLKSNKEIAIINSVINSDEIEIADKLAVLFNAKKLRAKTYLYYDDSQEDIIAKYQPELDIKFLNAVYNLSEQLNGTIPSLSLAINPDTMEIKQADLTLGNSDFSLTGQLTDISNYFNDQTLLKGNFDLVSKSTDVYQLMEIFDGYGSEDSISAQVEEVTAEDDPFLVPKGIDIQLRTLIKQSVVNDNIIENIKGGLTVKDGTLILNQMGFTNRAANMQLTAMYRSDRKNHLFSGIDFHLLNIDIAELIALVPSVDTIIPMLKSFKGKGEFHLAGEAYLKSDYTPKQSTIRGAAAFQGQELTLMDTETFDMIASKLMFKKKAKNVIDSLSVEMTLFRDEVDLYPFLMVMDKYKAVISGRHNMDNSFNYHISVTDTPLPVRLGLNVSGTIDDLKYDLAPCKYKYLYNPEKQGALENQTLRLKKLISESLKENVKPIP